MSRQPLAQRNLRVATVSRRPRGMGQTFAHMVRGNGSAQVLGVGRGGVRAGWWDPEVQHVL